MEPHNEQLLKKPKFGRRMPAMEDCAKKHWCGSPLVLVRVGSPK